MSKILLREFYELCDGGTCQDLLTEQEKVLVKSGVLFLTGVMQKADQENGNGRVYGKRILEREVQNYQKMIDDRRALGELDHPEDSVVNLKNASHIVTKMWWDGSNVMGKVKVLDTPSGKILKSLVESGVKLGVSSRGSGNVTESGNVSDFEIVTVDVVAQPSAPEAYPTPIYERVMGSRRRAALMDVAYAATYDRSAQKHLESEVSRFITNLKKV
jgi:hypothetical protein